MGFTALDATSLEVGKRITNELMVNIKNDLDYLYGELSGQVTYNGLISNGGFEMDADADGRPDNWDISLFTGGGATLVSTATGWASPTHGSKTLCIDKPAGVGNGGALVLSDYFAVSSESLLDIGMMLYSNSASVINKVGVYTYDKDRTFSTSIDLYGSKALIGSTASESTRVGRDLRMVAALSNGRGGTSPRWARIGITAGSTEGASSGKTFIDRVYVNDNSFPNVSYSYAVTSWAETRKTITAGSTGGIELSVTTVGPDMSIPRIFGNTTMLIEFSMNVNCGFQQTGTTGGTDPPKWKLYTGFKISATTRMTDYPNVILDDTTANLSTGTAKVISGRNYYAPSSTYLNGYDLSVAIKGSRGYEGYDFWNPAETYGATFITAKPDNKVTVRVIDPDM